MKFCSNCKTKKVSAKGLCNSCYTAKWRTDHPKQQEETRQNYASTAKQNSKEWRKNNPEKQRQYTAKWIKNNPEKYKQTQTKAYNRKMKKETCEILERHEEDTKIDSQSLTTDFLKKVLRGDCY